MYMEKDVDSENKKNEEEERAISELMDQRKEQVKAFKKLLKNLKNEPKLK